MAMKIPSRQLFIDGEWREPTNKKRIPIINPVTEHIIGDIPAATADYVNIAVEATRRALSRNAGRDWSSASGGYRAKYLRAISAKNDVASCFEYYADLAEGLDAKQKSPVNIPMDTFKCHVLEEPIGVVGLITPWYFWLNELPSLDVYMESCPCSSCWLCCNSEAL